jgi:hypothetical protein
VKSLEPQVLSPSTIASPNATVRLVAVIVEKPEKVVTQPPTEPAVNEEEMSMPSYATSDAVSQRTSVRVEVGAWLHSVRHSSCTSQQSDPHPIQPIINSAVTKEPEEIAVGMTIAPAEVGPASFSGPALPTYALPRSLLQTSTSSPLESSSSGWPTWLTVMLIIAG